MSHFLLQLIRLSLTASVVAAVVLGVRLLLRRAPKVYSYVLWLLVFCRAILPVSFSSAFSLFNVFASGQQAADTKAAALLVPGTGNLSQAGGIGGGVLPGELTAAHPLEMTKASQAGGMDLWLLAGVIWLAGFMALLGYSLFSVWKLKKTVAFAVLTEDHIYESDQVDTAFVLGFFRPRIYLPAGLGKQERHLIVEHEQVHIRRHDHQIKIAAWLIALAHWFNPVIWMSFWFLGRDMELSCDERVLKNLGAQIRADYGDSLLALAAPGSFPMGIPLAFGESSIKARVKNVLRYRPVKIGVTAAALLLVGLTAYGCMSNPKEGKAGMDAAGQESAADQEGAVGQEGQQGNESGAQDAQTAEKLSFGETFAKAVGERDADAVYEMLSPALKASAEDYGIYTAENGARVMGVSSPFVPSGQEPVMTALEDGRVQFVMMAMVSDPSWFVWKGQLKVEKSEDGTKWQVEDWRMQMYSEVISLEDCLQAYLEQLPPYAKAADGIKSFGDWLQEHYEGGGNPGYYNNYATPTGALVMCLHLDQGSFFNSRIEEGTGDALVTYGWEDGQATFRMEQVKEDGIWIPVELVEYQYAEPEGDSMKQELFQDGDTEYYIGGLPLSLSEERGYPLGYGLYREKPDGSVYGETILLDHLLVEESLERPVLYDGERLIYWGAAEDTQVSAKIPALVSIKTDGRDRKTFMPQYGVAESLCYEEGWLYYEGWTNDSSFPRPICRIAPDLSGQPVKVGEIDGNLITVKDGTAYFLAAEGALENGIYRQDLQGGEASFWREIDFAADEWKCIGVEPLKEGERAGEDQNPADVRVTFLSQWDWQTTLEIGLSFAEP